MAGNQGLIKALILYARESKANLDAVKTWRDSAIAAMADGDGSQIVSGSSNGMSFARAAGGGNLTVSEWFQALQTVITSAALGYRGSTSTARFS